MAGPTDVKDHALFACPELQVVLPRLGQAEMSIGATADELGILVVLSVVLPIADLTDVASAPLAQGAAPAAPTVVRPFGGWERRRMPGLVVDVPIEPPTPTLQLFG